MEEKDKITSGDILRTVTKILLCLWLIVPIVNIFYPILDFELHVLAGLFLIVIKLYILNDGKNDGKIGKIMT